jgi:hypothetical protein
MGGQGSVAFIALPASGRDAISVSLDGHVVGFFSQADLDERTALDEPTRQALIHYSTDDTAYASRIDFLETLLTTFTKDAANGNLWNQYIRSRDQVVDLAFSNIVTIRVEDADLERVTQSLNRRGLWERLGSNLDHVNDYALLGLCTSLRFMRKDDVQFAFAKLGRNVDAITKLLRANPGSISLAIGKAPPDSIIAYY